MESSPSNLWLQRIRAGASPLRDRLRDRRFDLHNRVRSDFDAVAPPVDHLPDAVFLWVPKTAGTSLWHLLAGQGCRLYHRPHRIARYFENRGLVSFGHWDYGELLAQGTVSAAFDARAVRFAVVRNPYDRAVSLFHYLKRDGRLAPNVSFQDFTRRLAEGRYQPIGLYNARGLSICNPQVRWLEGSDGRWLPDVLGRLEELSDFRRRLGDRLGVPLAPVPKANVSTRRRGHYRDAYDPTSRANVTIAYADDLDRFDYSF